MTRAHKSLIVMLVALVGVWGCSQGDSKAVSSRHLDRIKSLEAKCASLEQECQAALSDRDRAIMRAQVADRIEALLPTVALCRTLSPDNPDAWRASFEREAPSCLAGATAESGAATGGVPSALSTGGADGC